MKKFIVIAAMMLSCLSISSQSHVTRDGNTFSIVSTKKIGEKVPVKKTKFTWKDSNGKIYPVYVSNNGAFFIIRTSKKTGKDYKYYLPKEVRIEMAKELSIEIKK